MVAGQAVISADGAYRYQLRRRWQSGASVVAFVMLNPSTADARLDDPTIRRCTGFASAWGHDALVVVNLFAYRATQPELLAETVDPIGPENDYHLEKVCLAADRVVCAWGAHPMAMERQEVVRKLLPNQVECLGTTLAGFPRHPLYLAATTEPTPFQFTSEGSYPSGKMAGRGQAAAGGHRRATPISPSRIARASRNFSPVLGRAAGPSI